MQKNPEQPNALPFVGESISKVSVKIPPFRSRRPHLWFSQVEASFKTAGIVNENTKYNYVVSSLDQATAEQLADIIETVGWRHR